MKTEYSLIKKYFINILVTLGNMEDDTLKLNLFVDLIFAIEETPLLEKNFDPILNIIRKINDYSIKRNITAHFPVFSVELNEKRLKANPIRNVKR